MDNIYIDWLKPTDTIAVSPNIIECIKGCKLVDANKLIINNH